MTEIIYSKKYPKETMEEKYKDLLEEEEDGAEKSLADAEKFFEELFKNVVYEELPGREEKSRKFIQQAIQVSEEYELDIEVQKLATGILVNLSFDGSMILARELKLLLAAADNAEIVLNVYERDVTLGLQYYTKALHHRGRCINHVDEKAEKELEDVIQSFPTHGEKQ